MSTSHPNVTLLAAVYADLRCIDRYADDDIVLHTAQRQVESGSGRFCGKAAVVAKMHALLRQSGDSLAMHVDTIVANDYFGVVMGSIHARRGDHEIAMPFCGVWRFRDGRIVEHWENAYDISALDAFMDGVADGSSEWVRLPRKVTRRK